jgi:hypothetical protein
MRRQDQIAEIVFGRNEPALQHDHRSIAAARTADGTRLAAE